MTCLLLMHAGIDPAAIDQLGLYWEGVRQLYSPFESQGLKAGSSEVYSHEMPGGQYTNLKFQALSLGLGDQWPKVELSGSLMLLITSP